jgi:hypothetical protein
MDDLAARSTSVAVARADWWAGESTRGLLTGHHTGGPGGRGMGGGMGMGGVVECVSLEKSKAHTHLTTQSRSCVVCLRQDNHT